MAKKNVVTEVVDVEINNAPDQEMAQEPINDTPSQNDNINMETAQFLVDTMNGLINYINVANSRGAFTLEEAGTIWNIIKTAQERLK